MSYDVRAGLDWHNYTYNMVAFFNAFEVNPNSWDGLNRIDVAGRIDLALEKIERRDLAALKEEYDSPNGWGDVETALGFLRSVRDSCLQTIPAKVRVT